MVLVAEPLPMLSRPGTHHHVFGDGWILSKSVVVGADFNFRVFSFSSLGPPSSSARRRRGGRRGKERRRRRRRRRERASSPRRRPPSGSSGDGRRRNVCQSTKGSSYRHPPPPPVGILGILQARIFAVPGGRRRKRRCRKLR